MRRSFPAGMAPLVGHTAPYGGSTVLNLGIELIPRAHSGSKGVTGVSFLPRCKTMLIRLTLSSRRITT
ncbi:MAG: hypothetical protein WAU05_13360, partial [Nitrospira sp.]